MKLTPSRCPVCAADPKLILETIYAETGLQPTDSNGETEFENGRGIQVLWDSVRPALLDGKVKVRCAASHEWLAEMRS
jgi:hypothetical protein